MDGETVDLLRRAMARSGTTSRRLAARTGVSEGRISDYLSGRHTPGAARLARLVAATGHRLEVVRDLDANGLVLPELLALADAVALDPARPTRDEEPPIFRQLLAGRG